MNETRYKSCHHARCRDVKVRLRRHVARRALAERVAKLARGLAHRGGALGGRGYAAAVSKSRSASFAIDSACVATSHPYRAIPSRRPRRPEKQKWSPVNTAPSPPPQTAASARKLSEPRSGVCDARHAVERPRPVAVELGLDGGHVDVRPLRGCPHIGGVHHAVHAWIALLPAIHVADIVHVAEKHVVDAADGVELPREPPAEPRRVDHHVGGGRAQEVRRRTKGVAAVVAQVVDIRQPRRVNRQREAVDRAAHRRLVGLGADRARRARDDRRERECLLRDRRRLLVDDHLVRPSTGRCRSRCSSRRRKGCRPHSRRAASWRRAPCAARSCG